MTCPKCRGEMRQYERSGVTVDQCSECRGIFLDRGELEKLFEAEANWNRQQAPAGPPVPTAVPPQTGGYTPPPPPPGAGGYVPPPPPPGTGGYAPPPPPAHAQPSYAAGGHVPPPPPPPPTHGYPPAPAYGGHYGYHGHYRNKRHKSFLNELFD